MSERRVDEEALRLLAAFAGDANLRRAAGELGLPRSTLSRRLADLEQRLGQALCLRRGRTLTLTAFGERLAAHAKAARDALRELESAALEAAAGGRSITIATSPLFAEMVLPSALAAVCARHAGLRVGVTLSHGYADLFAGRVDVALRRGPLPDSASLNAKRLGRLSMACVASRRLPRSAAPRADDRARALPWVLVGASLEPFTLRLPLDGRVAGVVLTPLVAVDSQRVALELALRGLGAARVNVFLARDHLACGELVDVLPEARSVESVFAVYPRRARPDLVVRDLVAAVAERCRELDIWDP